MNILILGASLESNNEGVNALAVGAIEVLLQNYPKAKISILSLGFEDDDKEVYVTVSSGKEVPVQLYYVSKNELIKAYFSSIFSSKSINKVSDIINSSDKVFDINEGDSFSDIYGAKRLLRHFLDSRIALNLKKELVFLPQTIGPFSTKLGRILSKNILTDLSTLYVRDTKAFSYLEKINVDKNLTIDMAVYMPVKPHDFKVKENTIGLNVNGLMYFNSYASMKEKYANYKYFLRVLVEKLIALGFNVLLIPHTYNVENPGATEDDLQAIKDFVKNNSDLTGTITYVDKKYNAQELKYILSQLEFFLGSRMHSCIGALSRSVPTIGLAYSYKFEGTFDMFKQKEHVITASNIRKEDIEQIITEIEDKINLRQTTRGILLHENGSRQKLKLQN